MKIALDRADGLALAEAFPALARGLHEALELGHRIVLSSSALPAEALEALAERHAGSQPGRAAQLRALAGVRRDAGPRLSAAEGIEALLPALLRHLGEGTRHGWLFAAQAEGKPLPWVPVRIDFLPGSAEELAKVVLELRAYARTGAQSLSLRFAAADLGAEGATVAELLARRGLLPETPALLAAYEASAAAYVDWRGRHGAQFTGRGMGEIAEDPQATHRDTDWSRKDRVVLDAGGAPARLVNDEGVLPPRAVDLALPGDILAGYLRRATRGNQHEHEAEVRAIAEALPAGLFTALPVQAWLFVFHLELHQHLWVHVDDLQPYAYRPELRHKLVLPPEQTELIDILVAEMDLLQDDLVRGKGGGTTVLCAGPPGVGKTLTAEVYAELTGRPLYRVHSGQLGLSVGAMEAALKEALLRAQRWGAVMLIDEADVYIRQRAGDLAANAVVGVFLRVLEYFDGLLFMTTNRIDDIDEAVVSRCIALIRYHPPDRAARERIWGVMAQQFGLALDAATIRTLAATYPQASGRDIKGLAKLVARFSRHLGEPPTLAMFARCAMFRALEAQGAEAPPVAPPATVPA